MPATRLHRRPDQRRALPVPLDQRCQVIPAQGQPGCLRRGFGKPRRLCREHRDQYKAFYAAYKRSSWQVERLDDEIATEPDWALMSQWDKARVDLAVSLRTRHVDAINAEIAGREKHQRLFIDDPDEGHVGWLDRLRAKRQRSTDILVRLRRRAEELAHTHEQRPVETRPEPVPAPVWQAQRRAAEARKAEQARTRRAQVFQRISQEEQRRVVLDVTHRWDEARRQQVAHPEAEGSIVGPYSNFSSPAAGQSRAAPTLLPSARAEPRETDPLLIHSAHAPPGSYSYRAPSTTIPIHFTNARSGPNSYRAPNRPRYDTEAQRTGRKPWLLRFILLTLLPLLILGCISYVLLSSWR
ncbi:hypothetical protein C8Q70DRAFT_1053702 [Cubamyces menziesii]|nr:hypothetical protein C8Q70DRAFT_1053702 [Cubamyces menziesii]